MIRSPTTSGCPYTAPSSRARHATASLRTGGTPGATPPRDRVLLNVGHAAAGCATATAWPPDEAEDKDGESGAEVPDAGDAALVHAVLTPAARTMPNSAARRAPVIIRQVSA